MTGALVIATAAGAAAIAILFVLALARIAAKPTPPITGPVGEDEGADEDV